MGYYKCPRCGSTDTFQGTELVGGHSQGRTVGMSNDHGGYIQRHEGGELEHKEVSVIKCRDCGEILGGKDYFETEKERKKRKKKAKREKEDSRNGWIVLIVTGLIIAAGVYGLILLLG